MSDKRWTRSDFIIMGILFAMLVAWGPLMQRFAGTKEPAPALVPIPAVAETDPGVAASLPPAPDTPVIAPVVAEAARPAAGRPDEKPAVLHAPARADTPAETWPAVEPEQKPESGLRAARLAPENIVILSNTFVRAAVSRLGGGVAYVEMLRYPESPESAASLKLDFADQPALSLVPHDRRGGERLVAFGPDQLFEMEADADGRTVRLTRTAEDGLRLERTLTLGEDYKLILSDTFQNPGVAEVWLPEYGVRAGPLAGASAAVDSRQGFYLGVDTLSSLGGADVHHWAGGGFFGRTAKLADFFLPAERRGGGCDATKPALAEPLPREIRHAVRDRTDWLAAKNKFFTQIMVPKGGAAGFVLGAERVVPPMEMREQPQTWVTAPMIAGVSAVMVLDEENIQPGGSTIRELSYYAGPKEYTRIAPMGNRIVDIMEFGWLRPLCRILLATLNGLYAVIPNYGVAIILLTLLIRLVFWPVTHKSTESMRRMQEIQPMLAQLREKYKGKPQKIQEETMKLYKEHKVNPLGGCLPMLIQIPVFIALFNVLRSAVELRYADFLWVRDLSEPENLFAGMLPFISGLNILPLIMTATSIWQSHMTPTGGDASQQKMMMWMMPLMMLFIFYSMPSALVLYWTANQVIMIVQLFWQKRMKQARAEG